MRTTVDIDEDVLEAARAIARVERRSMGSVVSELARRGLEPSADFMVFEDGLPVVKVSRGAPPITDEMVRAALDEW